MKTHISLWVVLLSSVFWFSPVSAEQDNESIFKSLDTNGDGILTKQEVANVKALINDWSKVDGNKNGAIEFSEFSALESAENYIPAEGDNEPIGAAPTD